MRHVTVCREPGGHWALLAVVSSTLEGERGEGPGRRPRHTRPAETAPMLPVWPSQGRSSGTGEGVFVKEHVLGQPSALAHPM